MAHQSMRMPSQGQGFLARSQSQSSSHLRSGVVCHARKVYDGKQICASKMLKALPGHESEVEQLLKDVTVYSLQQIKQRASGVVSFEAMREDPQTFHTWERYASHDHLGKHNTSEQFINFYLQVVPHLEHPVAMALYEYKNGQIGPACMSEGPKGEGGLDDATGATGAPGGASMSLRDGYDATAGRRARVDPPKPAAQPIDTLSSGLTAAKKQLEEGLSNLFGSGLFGTKK